MSLVHMPVVMKIFDTACDKTPRKYYEPVSAETSGNSLRKEVLHDLLLLFWLARFFLEGWQRFQ